MRKFFYIFTVLLAYVVFVGAMYARAADVSVQNTGFIPSNIWYSKTPFYAGETIKIHTVIYNGSSYNLSGKVEFLDNDTLIGRSDFSLLAAGQVRDVSVPWKPLEGKHITTARIVNASISLKEGPQTAITLANDQTTKNEISVDVDPATKAAQAQAEAVKASAVEQQASSAVTSALEAVTNVIPEPIKEGTAASVGVVENLRTTLETQLNDVKEKKGEEIDAIKARENLAQNTQQKDNKNTKVASAATSVTEKPFAYIIYGILALLQYFFSWRILFY